MEPLFTGVGVALVTLFDDDGELDAPATAEHAARLVDLGVRAVVVAGSTGEAAALDGAERRALLAAVTSAVDGGVPVLAGTGAPWTRQAVAFTEAAVEVGADGVLALSPPGTTDALPYYEQVVAAARGVPVLAYHYPKASPPGVPVAALPGLPVDGLKDSSGDPDRLLAELEVFDRPLYVGSSAYLALAGPLGCAGAILALANADPEDCVAAFAGDAVAQRRLASTHLEASSRFPAGIKAITAKRFGTSPAHRLG